MTDTRPLDPALFGDAAIDAETAKLNAQMIEQLTGQPEWWVVGPQAMRAARRRGEGPFPAPVNRHGYTDFRGANIVYGAFDLSMTPSQRQFGNTRLVLRTIDMQQFYNAFLPTNHRPPRPRYLAALRRSEGLVSCTVQRRNEGRAARRYLVHACALGRGGQ
jgi:hypothetical protein